MTAAADQELEPASALAEVHHQIPGLLSGPGASWTGGDARDVHGPAVDLHYEQDMHTLEQHAAYVPEVARQDAGRLGGQELTPRRRCPARRRPKAGSGQDPADRPLPHPVAQADQLTLGTAIAPARILPGLLLHEFPGILDRKSTRLNSSHPSISYAVFCLKKKK